MPEPQTKPPGIGFGAGHTAQYLTLAEGLQQAAEALEVDIAYIEKNGLSTAAASLRFEARCATITVLSAALCECVANTVLATVLTPDRFKKVEMEEMPRKWSREIPDALKCAVPTTSDLQELRRLHATRNSIVHSKATIFAEGDKVQFQGNDPDWVHLTPEVARKFILLPLRLAEVIPETAGILCYAIKSSLQQRQPRLPRVHVAEIIELLELITPEHRRVVRKHLDRLERQPD